MYHQPTQRRSSMSSSDSGSSSKHTSATSTPLLNNEAVDPVAIIGMACRLPGDINSPSQLWDMLIDQHSGQCDVPKSRWNVDAFYHPQGGDRPGSMKTRGGYFLQDDIRLFENSFFGVNDLEATYMDPQQRKLLEIAFECFESAGVRLEDASGAQIGCYVGNFTIDYTVMQSRDPEHYNRFAATGMGTTILANRISHTFNLKGPSMVLDTACSSSLFCLHTAVQAIRNGDCDAALVAGVNLIQSPEQHIATMKAGVLSGTSTSHTFDSLADGYGRADGVGALYIKRLDHAIRDRDPIRSLIRGTAVNSNGKTAGITLPSAIAQEAAIRKAHQVACLSINDTAYVECHGTGTQVGDPIEVEAVSRAFAARTRPGPLLIGGVKPNLGHSEAASGISAIIKASLALESGIIPATIGIRQLNPKIKSHEWNVEVVTQNTMWPVDRGDPTAPRRAGVSSFGYGGANAHVVLESPSAYLPPPGSVCAIASEGLFQSSQKFLLPFSATSLTALHHRVDSLNGQNFSILDLAHTLGERRSKLSIRGAIVSTQVELASKLCAEHLMVSENVNTTTAHPFAFIFTGQGAQWAGMGESLIDEFPVARAVLENMDAALQLIPHPPSWRLKEILSKSATTSSINQAVYAQPACTALQIMLVDILASWNITPISVLGHSSGEIAASYAAGQISAEQAVVTAYYRGHVVNNSRNDGLMMAVGLSAKDAKAELVEMELCSAVTVACINSPVSVTLSGDAAAIEELDRRFEKRGVFRRKLSTDGRAYHSHHMAGIGQQYEDLMLAAFKKLRQPVFVDREISMFSTVSSIKLTKQPDAKYWRTNLESPVLFSPALELLQKGSKYHLIELGPHAALKGPISQFRKELGIKESNLPYSAAVTRGCDPAISLLNMVGGLFISGHEVSFRAVNSRHHGQINTPQTAIARTLELPPYQWTYDQVLWEENRASEEFRHRKHPHHEVLGSQTCGGNQTNFTWRKVLQPKMIPWLQDHKLDDTIIFPAAAYIVMAIEAVMQVTERCSSDDCVELRDIRILNAMAFDDENTSIEVFTTIQRQRISAAAVSKTWWHFEIVSVKDNSSSVHATGQARFSINDIPFERSFEIDRAVMEDSAIRSWYAKLAQEGLNFGSSFRSIESLQIHRERSILQTSSEAPLLRRTDGAIKEDSVYIMHPITIDAMMQTGLMATSAGILQTLKAQIPIAIEHAIFRASPLSDSPISHRITARAEVKGLGQMDLWAELSARNGETYAKMSNIRVTRYAGSSKTLDLSNRHPMLRVVWKPDLYGLGLLHPDQFQQTLTRHIYATNTSSSFSTLDKLLAAVDLISHKNPRARVLYVDHFQPLLQDSIKRLQACVDVLEIGKAFARCRSFTVGKKTEQGILAAKSPQAWSALENVQWSEPSVNQKFELIISTRPGLDASVIDSYLAPRGLVLTPSPQAVFHPVGFYSETRCSSSSVDKHLIMAQKPLLRSVTDCSDSQFIIVEQQANNRLGLAIAESLMQHHCEVKQISLTQIEPGSITPGSKVVVTVETEVAFLSSITKAGMQRMKEITNNASVVVWLTSADLKNCSHPDTALVGGLSRSVMLEQPALKFFTLDLDAKSSAEVAAKSVASIFSQIETGEVTDYEYVQEDGVVHVSRFIPDDRLNERFQQRQHNRAVELPLKNALHSKLVLQELGNCDSIAFEQEFPENGLPANHVEVEVKSMGLNAKDVYGLRGLTETAYATCGLEYSGIVRAVGTNVTTVTPGDRVVVMAPHHGRPVTVSPAWTCIRMLDNEDFNQLAVLNVVHSTAIYGLLYRGQLKANETVLIHSGAGGLGIAAIQIAKLVGANIFTTVGSDEKRDYLVREFGVDPAQVFSSRNSSFLNGVLKATGGLGVDVVLNSLTGDLLHDSWRACAEFGRFIEVGKHDIANAGSLNMNQFSKSRTFTTFDLSDLYHSANPAIRGVWSRLMKHTMELRRSGKIRDVLPLQVFDISQISDAIRCFLAPSRMGKIAISLERPDSNIQVLPFKYKTTFSPRKTYLLVGCLGGLGGCIAQWMLDRGAKKLAFLGRTGTDRPAARNLVERLQSKGAEITVVRGDVNSMSDVQRAVDGIAGLLGGVVQAAMVLEEALFTNMSETSWHIGVDPKLQGSWNLHNAVAQREQTNKLEFFFMTSSISGSVGTATESNYCAANYFLDAFARYRMQRGLRATSLGLGMISEVGYLHEHPEIEALLLRKGIQSISQEELIQIVDLALHDQDTLPPELAADPLARSHLLTGLESHGLKTLRKNGFDGSNVVLNDPRAALLVCASGDDESTTAPIKSVSMSANLTTALEETNGNLDDAVEKLVVKKFSSLTLVKVEKLDKERKLQAYGMDSMLAADFRTWIYQVFRSDVSFFEILSDTATLGSIGKSILRKLTVS